MSRPKLVLLLTDVHSELSLCLCSCFCFCFSVLKRHGVFYTSAIPEVMWYDPLYNRHQHEIFSILRIEREIQTLDLLFLSKFSEIIQQSFCLSTQSLQSFSFLSVSSNQEFLSLFVFSFRFFHVSVSWWFYPGVWVIASLLKSPGLVSGFWPFLAILSLG